MYGSQQICLSFFVGIEASDFQPHENVKKCLLVCIRFGSMAVKASSSHQLETKSALWRTLSSHFFKEFD